MSEYVLLKSHSEVILKTELRIYNPYYLADNGRSPLKMTDLG